MFGLEFGYPTFLKNLLTIFSPVSPDDLESSPDIFIHLHAIRCDEYILPKNLYLKTNYSFRLHSVD